MINNLKWYKACQKSSEEGEICNLATLLAKIFPNETPAIYEAVYDIFLIILNYSFKNKKDDINSDNSWNRCLTLVNFLWAAS